MMKGAGGDLSWIAWKYIGINEWPGKDLSWVDKKVCGTFPKTCEFIKALASAQTNDIDAWNKFRSRVMGGASFKQIVHFA